MGKFLTSTWIACITLLVLLGIRIWDPAPVETLRLKTFDYLQSLSEQRTSQDIVLLDIGEPSLDAYGQWPWPRDYFANIIGKLRANGAQLITFVVFFPEQDRMGKDSEFALALQQNPGVILSQSASSGSIRSHGRHIGYSAIGEDPEPWLFSWPGLVKNIDELESSAAGVGMVAVAPEVDQLVRRLPLMVRVDDSVYPALAVEFIRVATGDPSYQVKTGTGGIQAVRVPGFAVIPTDPHSRTWIDFSTQFERIEVSDPDWSSVNGKHVFVGTTAAGLANFISTPGGIMYPHQIQASLTQTLIDGTNITRRDFMNMLEAIVFAVFGIILLVIVPRASVIWTIPLLLAYLAGVSGYSYWEYTTQLNLVDASYPVIAGFILFSHLVYNNFAREFRQKQEIKKQFAGYASPTVVRMLQENPSLIRDGMKREISICFSDLRGFTPLGESFGDDVKGLTQIMNGYMDAITQPILDADGMVIKYIGDATMHVHNAPMDDPNHPRSAVITGLNMLKAVEKFNERIVAEGRPPVGMGAGINTGVGYLGEMGSTARHSYDVLGDAISTAARIESKCKEYGCLLLVGENTHDATENDFFYLKVDELAVKGKTVGIRIYTVLGENSWVQENTNWFMAQQQHDKMHELYRAQQFDAAIRLCNDLMQEFDGRMMGYYSMWIERCEFMKTQSLPRDWDGIFHATTK